MWRPVGLLGVCVGVGVGAVAWCYDHRRQETNIPYHAFSRTYYATPPNYVPDIHRETKLLIETLIKDKKFPILVSGHRGAGKTALIDQIVQQLPDAYFVSRWVDDESITQFVKQRSPSLLVFDDPCLELIHRIDRAPPTWPVVVTSNAGKSLPSLLTSTNRFRFVIVPDQVSQDDAIKLVEAKLPTTIQNFVQEKKKEIAQRIYETVGGCPGNLTDVAQNIVDDSVVEKCLVKSKRQELNRLYDFFTTYVGKTISGEEFRQRLQDIVETPDVRYVYNGDDVYPKTRLTEVTAKEYLKLQDLHQHQQQQRTSTPNDKDDKINKVRVAVKRHCVGDDDHTCWTRVQGYLEDLLQGEVIIPISQGRDLHLMSTFESMGLTRRKTIEGVDFYIFASSADNDDVVEQTLKVVRRRTRPNE